MYQTMSFIQLMFTSFPLCCCSWVVDGHSWVREGKLCWDRDGKWSTRIKEYWFSQNLIRIRQFMYSLPCRFKTLMISHIYTSTVCKGCYESEVSWSHMLLHRRWEIQVMTYDLPCTTAAVTSSFHRQNRRAHLTQSWCRQLLLGSDGPSQHL